MKKNKEKKITKKEFAKQWLLADKLNFKEEMYEHYKELFTTSCNELHFANLQIKYLYSVLDELITFCGTLEKSVIKNALERHQLDKIIHAKLLFNCNDKLKDNA